MMLKKVLLITYYFPPSAASGSFRLLGFARHLPRTGWQPLVVAPPEMPWEPVDPLLADDVPIDAIVHPAPYPAWAPDILRRRAPYAIWLPRAWFACQRMIQTYRPEVILTSGPPHCVHVLGHYLKQLTGVPWVADFRDPWISDGKSRRLTWMQRWQRRWEQTVFQSADVILANAPNACRMFQESYPMARAKIVTLTNGFDPPACRAEPAVSRDSCLRLLHAGELYAGRDPLPLLEAMASLNAVAPQQPSFKLHHIGRHDTDGIDFPRLLQERGRTDLVELEGQLAYRDSLDAMDKADILVLLDTPGRTIGVPAKLYEYFGAGRPILALAEPEGDAAAILRASGVTHRTVSLRNSSQIQQALRDLRQEIQCGRSVPNYACLRQFTREYLAKSLAQMLDALAGHGGLSSMRVRLTDAPVPAVRAKVGREAVQLSR